MTDADLRQIACDIIIDMFQEVGVRLDAKGLAEACPLAEDMTPEEVARTAQLIDSALVEVAVDWLGGAPV